MRTDSEEGAARDVLIPVTSAYINVIILSAGKVLLRAKSK